MPRGAEVRRILFIAIAVALAVGAVIMLPILSSRGEKPAPPALADDARRDTERVQRVRQVARVIYRHAERDRAPVARQLLNRARDERVALTGQARVGERVSGEHDRARDIAPRKMRVVSIDPKSRIFVSPTCPFERLMMSALPLFITSGMLSVEEF